MEKILLIGTGPMAVDYASVLSAFSKVPTVIGRGETSAAVFEAKTGIKPMLGGVEKYLDSNSCEGDLAIIATGTEALMPTLLQLVRSGVKKILIEKPAAISIEELLENSEKLMPFSDSVFIAYNRRFYASVIETIKLIEEDGGLRSMSFEFTEWAHRIEPLQKAPGVKENWFFANSTHVVDLAFFIAGKPKEWSCFSGSGAITWHAKTNFAGAGITEKDVLFSYLSNWESAGRWSLELLTANRRIYLKPLEEILIQQKGSVNIEKHTFDDAMDKDFKPGLFKQVEAFFSAGNSSMISLKEHMAQSKDVFQKILN
ncbi:MAG: myo-inositol 2-dehydrogenase [Flavobacterium sp. BFFFF1]|uniref:Gfo/Idh/MocA family oxidoreductase n=1 Tax=Flavobacterium sp. BFFFF1 TaxID=2015557 RepID=UPI000BC72B0A|nr:Gfo/Idh/MocA family oxidoreductase [Flavobacterium sp. BFFFF1]OYU81524.1 MAG: myo-inositol 2-dehydrogenase [Flavobacterium sp. BFFFF1]